jgi:hypothetical protein
MRVYTHGTGITFKRALYSSDRSTVVASGTGSSVADGWAEITLSASTPVTAQQYIVAFCPSAKITVRKTTGASQWNIDTYARFSVTPLTSGTSNS